MKWKYSCLENEFRDERGIILGLFTQKYERCLHLRGTKIIPTVFMMLREKNRCQTFFIIVLRCNLYRGVKMNFIIKEFKTEINMRLNWSRTILKDIWILMKDFDLFFCRNLWKLQEGIWTEGWQSVVKFYFPVRNK